MSSDSFCLDVDRLERLMARDDYRVLERTAPGRGTTDVEIVTVEVPDRGRKIRFRMKWKPSAPNGEGFNNSPRKELAAYELQKLFLSPEEYVVPPTTARCVPLERMREELGVTDPQPTFPGSDCVLITASYWMENVTNQNVMHSWRFQVDARYRKAVSNLNLLTYLIDHRDTHDGNFLISRDTKRPRAFSVDNGLAFSGLLRNPMPWLRDDPIWSNIIVPALPREKIQVFREVTRAQLETLGTVVQLAPKDGVLVRVDRSPPFDPEEGVRVRGRVVQLGLTKDEIDGLEDRIEKLLDKVEDREIALF